MRVLVLHNGKETPRTAVRPLDYYQINHLTSPIRRVMIITESGDYRPHRLQPPPDYLPYSIVPSAEDGEIRE